MSSRYSKTSVFVRPHVNESRRFQESSIRWRAFWKRCVFGDCFHQIRMDGGPNRRKKISLFRQKRKRVDGALVRLEKGFGFAKKKKKTSSDGNFISVKYIAWMSNYDNIKFTMHFFKVKFIVTCLIFNKSKKLCFCVHDYCGEAVRFFYTSKESGRLGILGNISSLTASIIFS